MKQRLFIAAVIPDDIKEFILTNLNLPSFYRKTKKENIHITLFFLGDTEVEKITAIIKSVDEILNLQESFDLEINSYGQFPDRGTAKIVYATGDKGLDKLKELAEEIRTGMKIHGFSDNKEFKYHLTAARLNESGVLNRKLILPVLGSKKEFSLNEICLFKSTLLKSGPVYEILKKWNLK
jgi:RNA 2',3'-cyclic 3'-phosphodiesterase